MCVAKKVAVCDEEGDNEKRHFRSSFLFCCFRGCPLTETWSDEAYKKHIQPNHTYLVEHMKATEVSVLLFQSFLSWEDVESIQRQTTRQEKNRHLLGIVRRNGLLGVRQLLEALTKTRQEVLAQREPTAG